MWLILVKGSDNMVYNLIVSLDEIASAIGHAFRWLIGYLSTLVYNLIIVVYDLFEYLARAEIIDNSFVQEIYKKVGFLLGLFMLFKLIFSLIQSLIDPNKLNDKKNGYAKILMRSIISIVLLGITPTIFKEAYQLQNLLIGSYNNSDNVLYKLIIGSSDTGTDSFGRVISTEAYFAFYRDDEFPFLSNSVDTTGNSQHYDSKISEIKSKIRSGERNFDYAQQYLNYNYDGVYTIEFNELLSLVFGVAILWMLVVYCIQVAIRVFQLAYLQIVAPVPILSYISDSEGSFSKWLKQCMSTFLDLFIRLAIIYFVIYFAQRITLLFENNDSILASSTGLDPNNFWMWSLLEVFLILGLLFFAKKVPDLIKDLFPNMGGAGKFSFGLNPKKEVFEPLKKMYNSTPLGWAPKALGWAGKKTIGAIDRKVHNLPKPRNKVQQYFDKLAPGYADAAKYAEEKRKFDNSMKNGKALSDQLGDVKLGGNSTVDDFTKFGFNADYANAYINHERATDNVNKISAALEEARTRGDAARVGELTTELGKAQSTQTKMKKALEYQEGQHKRDATRMADYKLYCSRTKTVESWENSSSSSNQNEPSQNFDSASVVNRVNNITGVDRSPASENGAPTAENSLLAQLAEQAHQQEMQQEFMNRGNNNSPTSAPTDGNSYDSSDNYRYASQEQWDERIEFATEKMQELATNGSSQEEIDAQLKVLENLQNGKKQSLQKDHEVSDHLDDFYDRQNDGFGGQ